MTWISVAPGAGHALGYSLNDLHGVTAGIVSLVVWVLIFIPYTFVAGALMRTESDAGVED